MAIGWYRCPNCGNASPDCFDEESAEAPAWEPDRIPCDTCGEHEVVICPHCHTDYDPHSSDRVAVSSNAQFQPPAEVVAPARHASTWPPVSWR